MSPHNKTCIRCKAEKPCTDFYKHSKMADGFLGKCKECCKTEAIQNRKKKEEYYRTYDKERKVLPHRKALRKLVFDRQKEAFPEKTKARYIVSNAIRSGKLVKEPCEVCGETRVHGHHEDYSKPLLVKWLCPVHHAAAHNI